MALIAIASIIASLFLGYGLTKKIKCQSLLERLVFSFVFGGILFAFASFLLSFAVGFGSNSLISTTALFLITGFFLTKKITLEKTNKTELLVLLLALAIFLPLLYTHSLEPKADGVYSAGSTWADIAFHSTIINSFKERGMDLDYAIFAGQKLGYHFMFDFYTAELSEGGFSVRDALIASSLLFSVCFTLLLYFFSLRVSKNKIASFAAVLIVLLSGGVGFFYFAQNIASGGGQSLGTALSVDYVHLEDKGLLWWSSLGDHLLPQRQFVAGLSMLLIVLILLFEAIKQNKSDYLPYAGALGGLMPLVHAQSFIAIALSSVLLFALFRRLNWKKFFIPFALISLPQALWSASQVHSFLRFQPFWYSENPLVFFAKNIGAPLVLIAVGFFFAESKERKFFASAGAIFLAANLFVFQPWPNDNMRFYFISLLVLAPLAAKAITSALRGKRAWFAAAVATLFILGILSGTLSLARESTLSYKLYSNQDLQLASWLKENTPKDALFLTTYEKHNHPVFSLAGRRVFMGYWGWLWSHGINYEERKSQVDEMFGGNIALMKEKQIDYVVTDEKTKASMPSLPLAYEIGEYRVYKVQ